MAPLLGCEKIFLSYPAKKLLVGVTLGIDEGMRVGIVGRNGDGKSSLVNILAGITTPDEGLVTRRNGVSVGVLAQRDLLDPEATVGFSIVGDMPEYLWAGDARIRGIIDELVGDLAWDALLGTLSGGQRRRVDLARVLIGSWDVLILDEPTNHLDVPAIDWLARHLNDRWRAREGALLVVTHDRWFLDEVCTSMWEVHDGIVEPFEGGYSAYVQQRAERDEAITKAETKRKNLMRRELAWLSRGARARSSKPKFHVKAARELIAADPPLRDSVELKRVAMSRLGKQVIDLEDASAGYEGKTVIDHVDWIIGAGDRFGILGLNGAGKTTLLNLIQGKMEPSSGRVKIGKTVRFAVLSQQLHELDALGANRVREVIAQSKNYVVIDGKETTPAQLLERLGFKNEELSTPVCDLSGGQKRRLQLMLILLDKPNVLILDEPGNDLDTDMLAATETLLDGWPGTLLVVTHDRYLMERVTDDQFALLDGHVRHLPGGVDQYLELLAARDEAASEPAAASKPVKEKGSGLSQNEIRALKKRVSSVERKMSTMRGKIEDARTKMDSVDATDFIALGEAQAKITELEDQLGVLEEEWLAASEELED